MYVFVMRYLWGELDTSTPYVLTNMINCVNFKNISLYLWWNKAPLFSFTLEPWGIPIPSIFLTRFNFYSMRDVDELDTTDRNLWQLKAWIVYWIECRLDWIFLRSLRVQTYLITHCLVYQIIAGHRQTVTTLLIYDRRRSYSVWD